MVDERGLLHQARLLDGTALAAVFDTYYQPLYRYIYYHVRHQATAENLTGEVFTRLVAQIAQGGGPKRHLRGWLYRVAYNLVVDDSRRRVHRDHEPLGEWMVSGEPDVEAQVQATILRQHAWEALEQLTTKQCAVIVLKYLEGLENKEIACILGMSVGTVKSLQHRGLASMRRHLARMGATTEELA